MRGLVQAAGETPVSVRRMRDEIVMVAADFAADGRGERVFLITIRAAGRGAFRIVVVIGMLQRLGNDVVLERDHRRLAANGAALPRTARLVNRPTDRAMINDRVRGISQPDSIHRLLARVAETTAHETHDDIIATAHPRAPVREANALARRGLAGHGQIAVADDAG